MQAFCLEFDDRFKVFGEDFVFYDYNEPLRLPVEFKNSFDIVLLDPPFLSEECLCKVAVTVRYLMKDKVLLCTGEIHQHKCTKADPPMKDNSLLRDHPLFEDHMFRSP